VVNEILPFPVALTLIEPSVAFELIVNGDVGEPLIMLPVESIVNPFKLIVPVLFVSNIISPVPAAVNNTSPVLSDVSDTFPVPLAAIVTEPFDVAPDCIVNVDAANGPVIVEPFWSTSMPFKLTFPVPVDDNLIVPDVNSIDCVALPELNWNVAMFGVVIVVPPVAISMVFNVTLPAGADKTTFPVAPAVSDAFPVPFALTEISQLVASEVYVIDAAVVGPLIVDASGAITMPFRLTVPVPVDVKTMVPLVADDEMVDVAVVAFPVESIVSLPSVDNPFTVNDTN